MHVSAVGRTVNFAETYNDEGRSMPRVLAAILDLGADKQGAPAVRVNIGRHTRCW